MQGEGLFDTDSVRHLADRERCVDSSTTALRDDALEYLNPLLVAFNDADMDGDGISGAKYRKILAHLFLIDSFDYCAHIVFC